MRVTEGRVALLTQTSTHEHHRHEGHLQPQNKGASRYDVRIRGGHGKADAIREFA